MMAGEAKALSKTLTWTGRDEHERAWKARIEVSQSDSHRVGEEKPSVFGKCVTRE